MGLNPLIRATVSGYRSCRKIAVRSGPPHTVPTRERHETVVQESGFPGVPQNYGRTRLRGNNNTRAWRVGREKQKCRRQTRADASIQASRWRSGTSQMAGFPDFWDLN